MAYGVKYRLEFSDNQLNKKKLEILKKDYSGTIFPLISDGDPINIETKSDDDFYEPIIGSNCTINLMVTDDVNYDNFYEYDEREYKVKLYFETSSSVYSLYWQGWITNDIYQETMISTPYLLTINANDGLGTLNGYNSWFPSDSDTCTLWQIIYKNLQNIGLEQDILISNDIKISTDTNWKNVFSNITIDKRGIFYKNYILNDAKKMLRTILMAINCKIFQSYGSLNIINCSSYNDQRIIEGVQNGTYSGSGILTAKQGFLNGGSEQIKYFLYNYLGIEQSNSTNNYLKSVKLNLTPVEQSLFREVRKPLKKYSMLTDISQQDIDLNYNASFEFDMQNWIVDFGSYVLDDTPFAGLKNFKFDDFTSTDDIFTEKLHSDNSGNIIQSQGYNFICSVRVDTSSSIVNFPWYVRYYDAGAASYQYWIDSVNSWSASSGILWNKNTIERRGKYVDIRSSITNPPSSGVCSIGIGTPYINGVSVSTYVDNLAIRLADRGVVYNSIDFNRVINTNIKNSAVLEHDNILIGNTTTETFLGAYLNNPTFKRCNDPNGITMEEIVTQQRLNDFKIFNKSYDGVYILNDAYSAVTMANKIWINFNNLQETDSAIIDNISYNVKSGRYHIRCHIPNNYTDVDSLYAASFEE